MNEFGENVIILDHPLITHKISILRDKNTGTNEFRQLVEEIAMLMGFVALSDLPMTKMPVETPIEKTETLVIAGRKLAIVPILRAGLGMVSGLTALVPSAKIGHIGLYRDETTHKPVEYFCKLPNPIEERIIVVCDPMLATGGSMELGYKAILSKGTPRHVHVACLLATPEGIAHIRKTFPEASTTIWCAAIDEGLNEHKYIVPGFGDAGDLCYGEKI